ncbi:MAG: PfkB family carbohydrate kinase [Clostridia bacterium]|jgi:2-dehydro-3-deoxygluconokinase
MAERIICFGEIMLRLSPPGHLRLVQANSLDVVYGGSEANVAVALAQLGLDASFVTRLPDNDLGAGAINELRRHGVDTRHIVRGGNRIGIYFLEKGASVRPSRVIYDRAGSSMAEAGPGDLDWREIFQGADWFHFSGITPALGESLAQLTEEGCRIAKEMGITVSCDLNYRSKLWSLEEAGRVMGKLIQYTDILIANEEHGQQIFDIQPVTEGQGMENCRHVARELTKRFHLKATAITLREGASASDTEWSAMLFDGKEFYYSPQYRIHIVDRVGGGDAFAAGLIYALCKKKDSRYALDFAAAACAWKHTVEGDANLASFEELEGLIKGGLSGRVQR